MKRAGEREGGGRQGEAEGHMVVGPMGDRFLRCCSETIGLIKK